ncbi:hypothetical protein AC1031_010645 [Aphanomyces cochlioides]|nr:hypothetical protein AC1031_010645 [Aphanomyces cochlioides]
MKLKLPPFSNSSSSSHLQGQNVSKCQPLENVQRVTPISFLRDVKPFFLSHGLDAKANGLLLLIAWTYFYARCQDVAGNVALQCFVDFATLGSLQNSSGCHTDECAEA